MNDLSSITSSEHKRTHSNCSIGSIYCIYGSCSLLRAPHIYSLEMGVKEMRNKLLIFGLLCIIAAGLISIISHVSAQTGTNQTSQANDTATVALLKQILGQQKLQISLQQDNANVQSIKLDIIKAELEKIQSTLSNPVIPPPPPPPFSQPLLPPSLNQTLNGTICKEHNDNGVIIQCPVFPGLQSPIPLPPLPPPGAVNCGSAPCSPFVPPIQAPQQQCGFMGIFC